MNDKKSRKIENNNGVIVLKSEKIHLHNEVSVTAKALMFIGIFIVGLSAMVLIFVFEEYFFAFLILVWFLYLTYRFGFVIEVQVNFKKGLVEKRRLCFDRLISRKELKLDLSMVKFQIIGPFFHMTKEDSDEFSHYFHIMKTPQEEFRLFKFGLVEDALHFRRVANEFYEREIIEDRSLETCNMSFW